MLKAGGAVQCSAEGSWGHFIAHIITTHCHNTAHFVHFITLTLISWLHPAHYSSYNGGESIGLLHVVRGGHTAMHKYCRLDSMEY